MIARISSMSEP